MEGRRAGTALAGEASKGGRNSAARISSVNTEPLRVRDHGAGSCEKQGSASLFPELHLSGRIRSCEN